MAISRMQQPRQLYGLGSFVKKATNKITRPFTKVASKVVPKEIAGIMRVAAPFLPSNLRAAAYLLGTAKQTGRISPIDLALVAAPRIGRIKLPKAFDDRNVVPPDPDSFRQRFAKFIPERLQGSTISQAIGKIPLPGEKNLGEFLVGAEAEPSGINLIDPAATAAAGKNVPLIPDAKATSGIFGQGGKFFQFGAKDSPKILDTKAGQFLLGGDDDKFSKAKLAGVGLSTLSLIQNSKTPEEAGTALAAATGDSDDYERGYQLFSQLTPELFNVPDKFRMDVKDGGIMRTNYARGSDDEPKPLPNDPTEPVNPFGPKPTGPVLPDRKASVDDPFYRSGDADEHSFRMFNKPYIELNADELEEFREEMMRLMNKFSGKDREGIMMVGGENNRVRELLLKEEREGLSEDEKEELRQLIKTISAQAPMLSDREGIMMAKEGGRANLALGSRPTAEESGLGGLPIEADMRYTGGFMPYGAKEKADDVPARLSKNEFVFTADAVRAAGGGSVNEGAKKMYQAMKQLEKKPEAKGMMA